MVFYLMDTQSGAIWSKSIGIVKKLLVVSKFAKALEHMSEIEAFKALPDKDRQFLEHLVLYLIRNRDKFVAACQAPFTEEDEDIGDPFARKFTSLLTSLGCNYEVLLIPQNEASAGLFTLLKDCAQATNLRIVIDSLRFWDEFKETITNRINNVSKFEHLFSNFKDISEIMLKQSLKLATIPYDQIE